MIGNIQNTNPNFGSLRISPDKVTKKAIVQYVDSMETARIMGNAINKLGDETGNIPVLIKGDIIPDLSDTTGKNFSILLSAFNNENSQEALSKIAVKKGDFQTSRVNLFEKFADEIITKIKTFMSR